MGLEGSDQFAGPEIKGKPCEVERWSGNILLGSWRGAVEEASVR